MSIEGELLKFSKSREVWQQDLIRRICIQPTLEESDLEHALANLKSSHGLGEGTTPQALREDHLAHPTPAPPDPTLLISISNVRGANRLADGQELTFAPKGITLIYGNNASGKTGYARIIKQVCRARREKAEPLLGNVYKPSTNPAEAEISFSVAGNQCLFRWVDGEPGPSELSQISVFDAASAPLYADHQSVIEFLPWGLDVLPSLGRACGALAQRIEADIAISEGALAVPVPDQIEGSAADALVQRLVPERPFTEIPTEKELRNAASWGKEDDEELRRIETELQRFSEPAKAAAQCRRFKASLSALTNRLGPISESLADDAIAAYRKQAARTEAAHEAASHAAKMGFETDPLGSAVGTAAWKSLYDAAQEFSSLAYPGEAFPATGAGKVCVLCQQPYAGNAADRMARFRAYVEDRSQQQAKNEAAALNQIISRISEIVLPTSREIDLQLAELVASEPMFASMRAALDTFLTECSSTKLALIDELKGSKASTIASGVNGTVIGAVGEYSNDLETRAKTFDASAEDSEAVSELKNKHKNLLARRQLNSSLGTVLWRRAELEKLDRLRRCRRSCDTTQISKKNSEFREKYLTAAFESALRSEVSRLGLSYLPLRIDAKSERGSSYVGVALKKMIPVRNSSVLSEGEFRALALAGFFAEIANVPNQSGIVVDDPVSSLDHRHMRQVAHRLVDEAKERAQVIVFTHDLSFYYDLWSAAAEAGVPVARSWVQHILPDRFGVITPNDGPWQVKKTRERLAVLNDMLLRMPEGVSLEEQAQIVRQFYARLRETWERLVEERLLNGVVGRFQAGVQTQSLKGVSVTDSDYKAVFFNMKKASEFSGHDWASGREGAVPTKDDMAKDLAVARAYESDLAKRSKQLEEQRRPLERPPAA